MLKNTLTPHFGSTGVECDEDMTPMHTTMIGAWNGVEEVQ
jgi:hypothetical protein